MSGTSDARGLAMLLAACDADRLARLLHRRRVAPSVPWRDCFDAAEALLEPGSLGRVLATLPRPDLRALDAATDGPVADALRGRLDDWALLDADGRPFRTVTAAVRAAAETDPACIADIAPPAEPAAADGAGTAAAAERAASAVRAITDIVALSEAQPVAVTGTGAVTAADRRRLADLHIVAADACAEDLFALAAAGGILVREGREWLVTDAAQAWLPAPLSGRWEVIATGWRAALPAALRTPVGGILPPGGWDEALPLDAEWPSRAEALRRQAELWGLCTPDGAEPAWAVPLRLGQDPDGEALAAVLPGEIEKIYLQADLTAIAPGPLQSRLDLRLRTMAVRESRAQASTYRFTAQSLAAAVAGGEDADSLRAFLTRLSLTGIPQPLAYLIDQAAARHGLVRVGTDADTGRTRVTSADPQLLRTIAVDQGLRAIGLVDDGAALLSRIPRDGVYWALADARYPVVAVDTSGDADRVDRRHATRIEQTDPAAALRPLAEALLAHSAGDADAAWLLRELEQAVREKRDLTVTVRMPDGTERAFTIEATGLGGGRLRGRDRTADVERTLPVASIVRVEPG